MTNMVILVQPKDFPLCLVREDRPQQNFLIVNETEEYGGPPGLATFPDVETARRVAACWNAFAGVSTEMVERFGSEVLRPLAEARGAP